MVDPAAAQASIRESGKNNYCNRMGTEAEVSAAVVFLASPMAAFITGDTMRYWRNALVHRVNAVE
jgi:citronellol/citronellal dehydrogenase